MLSLFSILELFITVSATCKSRICLLYTSLVDLDGKLLSPFHYTQLNRFHDGLAVFGKDGHFGYMDNTGTHIISNIFLLAWDFNNQFARYSLGRGIGFITTQGKAVHDVFYPDVRDYHDGLAKVQTVSR